MRRGWLAGLIAMTPLVALAQAAKPVPAMPASSPDAWQQRTVGELQILDTVNAHVTSVSLKVGQSADNASLSIALRSCVARPSDQSPDSAAFLDISDRRPGSPGFHGWMFANEPAIGLLEHPIYSVRLVACH